MSFTIQSHTRQCTLRTASDYSRNVSLVAVGNKKRKKKEKAKHRPAVLPLEEAQRPTGELRWYVVVYSQSVQA